MNKATLDQLQELFCQLESALALRRPLRIFIGGEAAAQIHCGLPVEGEVDVEFDAKHVAFPDLDIGSSPGLQIRRPPWNLTLLPSDYRSRAVPLNLGTTLLQPFVVSPLDAAVSLVGQGASEYGIVDLVRHQIISAGEFATRTRLVIDTELAGSVVAAKNSLNRVLETIKSDSQPSA